MSAKRPAVLRQRYASRRLEITRPANVALRLAEKAVAALARLSLDRLDTDDLLRLWRNRGGFWREFVSGELQLLNPAGEPFLRGTPDAVGTWLRARLVRLEIAA